jgi:hypothetical protein
MGIGPCVMIWNGLEDRRFVHRGQDGAPEMSFALTYAGETQFELITQTNDAPSPYPHFLGSGREGIHHLEFWPDGYPASCEALKRAGSESSVDLRAGRYEECELLREPAGRGGYGRGCPDDRLPGTSMS